MRSEIIQLELRFHPKEKGKLSKKDFSESSVPIVYYRYDEYIYLYYGQKYLSITYYMHYAENYAIGLNHMFPYNSSLGYHPIDIEILRILYDIETGIPQFVFFSAHAQEGIWVPFNKCEFINNKLIVYVALGSHAIKPHDGISLRIFGFANDHYSKNGQHISPLLIEDSSIQYTQLRNDEVFTSFIRRFFMPIIIKNKDKYLEEQKNKELNMNKLLIIQ